MRMPRRAVTAALIAVALTAAGCEGGGSSTPTGSPSTSSASSSPESAAALTGLKIDQPKRWTADPKTWRVTVSWHEPADFAVDHYEVHRDGLTVADDIQVASIEDGGVYPDASFEYMVVAVDAAGAQTTPAKKNVTTNAPPTEDARLQGRFIAKLHITSQSNLTSGASGGSAPMSFEPVCKRGPCDTILTFSHESDRLTRHGGSYEGTIRAPFHLSCAGEELVETLVFDLDIVKGVAGHGVWRASKLEGTLDESATGPGCLTAHIVFRVTAFLRRPV
jgi:hypothetical protein